MNKNFVYLSASGNPPFIERYITTKEEVESFLLDNEDIRTKLKPCILKPGFIYSYNERWWSLPIKYEVDIWNYVFGKFYHNLVPPNSLMKKVTK